MTVSGTRLFSLGLVSGDSVLVTLQNGPPQGGSSGMAEGETCQVLSPELTVKLELSKITI